MNSALLRFGFQSVWSNFHCRGKCFGGGLLENLRKCPILQDAFQGKQKSEEMSENSANPDRLTSSWDQLHLDVNSPRISLGRRGWYFTQPTTILGFSASTINKLGRTECVFLQLSGEKHKKGICFPY